ncbi:hypothetical protein HGRIS_002939 [Hohenbuehelia grisea]|uniref:Uncharacterized protein n=1 Tax=Hohenbuehelia grisea TaxID=104357 RepID=A0ABR3JNE9_9AGAR
MVKRSVPYPLEANFLRCDAALRLAAEQSFTLLCADTAVFGKLMMSSLMMASEPLKSPIKSILDWSILQHCETVDLRRHIVRRVERPIARAQLYWRQHGCRIRNRLQMALL